MKFCLYIALLLDILNKKRYYIQGKNNLKPLAAFAKALFLRISVGGECFVDMKINLKAPFEYISILVKWTAVALIVGAIGGLVGSAFHMSIDKVTELRVHNLWVICLLPIGGLVITFLYRLARGMGRIDTNRVIESVRGEEPVPFVMMPLIFVSTVISHLLGASVGREGAALQLGGSIGYALGRVFRLDSRDKHIIVMSGMSAVFAALFGTPIAAMFFALEVTSVGVMYYAGLVPCAISAIVASRIAAGFGLAPVRFGGSIAFEGVDMLSFDIVRIIVLVVLCAAVSILFCFAIEKFEHYGKKLVANHYLRSVLGGVLLVVLTVILQTTDYNGAGMDVIERAIAGEARYEAFLIKILFTAISIAAGFKGGEIVPAFFVGSTFGCVAGGFLGLDPSLSAALGFVALFCGVVNCPVASFVLALEIFGGRALPLFALVCAISYTMSGYSGLYKSQKIVYSKLRDEYVNADTK